MVWYTGNATYDTVLIIGFLFVMFVIFGAFFTQSPYGRFASDKYGISLNPKLGWWLMEIPATVVFLYFFITGTNNTSPVVIVLCLVWLIHYANRGWFFPLSIRVAKSERKSFGIMVVALGMFVTAMHGYLNATFFTEYGEHLQTIDWFTDPRFMIGIIIYYFGYILTVHSEAVVRNLRDPNDLESGKEEFKIPYGGGYKYVSSPTYLGELIAWAGFSIMTWSWAGVLIFCITAGNLIPRAFATHKWYLEAFDDYPKDRKALIPFIK